MVIKKVELEKVIGVTSKIPEMPYPEFAFAGKSNVGKSSLINALMNRKALARVSAQPGKTQTINYYNVNDKIYNSTANDILARHCRNAEVPIISIHGLRHTHASLLLFAGVSIASVARRLGHSNITTTQKTYLHIIQELESKDIDIIMRSLSNLNS